MQPLEFIVFFLLLIILSSFFIVAFYGITRHYIEIQPDNTEKTKGELLKFWSVFLEGIAGVKKTYYSGEALEYKLKDLKHKIHSIGSKLSIVPENTSLISSSELSEDEIFKIETVLQCQTEQKGDIIFLYLEEPIYVFPSFIRKPLSSCTKCMATPFGSGIWLLVNYLYNPFTWTSHKIFGFIAFWVIFITVLSKCNEYIFRKTI